MLKKLAQGVSNPSNPKLVPARVHEPTGLPVEAAVEERAGASQADEVDQQDVAPEHSAATHR